MSREPAGASREEEEAWLSADDEDDEELRVGTLDAAIREAAHAALVEDATATAEASEKGPKLTPEQRNRLLMLHRIGLLMALGSLARRSVSCDDARVQALLASQAPPSVIWECNNVPENASAARNLGGVEALLGWFRTRFEVVANDPLARTRALDVPELRRLVSGRILTRTEAACLFAGCCRGVGVHARLVGILDAPPPLAADETAARTEAFPEWVEVFVERKTGESGWVSICPSRGYVGNPVGFTRHRAKANLPGFIVGVSGTRSVKDVTRRYWPRQGEIDRWRGKCSAAEWFPLVLASVQHRLQLEVIRRDHLRAPIASSESSHTVEAEAEVSERVEFELSSLTEAIPTSLAAFRNHALYCLESQLTEHQVLRPKHPVVGLFRGQPVYPRTCVQTLRSERKWLQECGRQVRAEELGAPVAVVQRKRRRAPKRSLAQVESVEQLPAVPLESMEERIPLYGEWQTERFEPPPVVDGVVPKNSFGNYELWNPSCLPDGATHVVLPRIAPVASRLGISFAPAVVGFEWRAGVSTPKIEGVVVPAESADVLRAAWEESEAARVAAAREKASAHRTRMWAVFARGLLLQQRVKARFELASQLSKRTQEVPQRETIMASASVAPELAITAASSAPSRDMESTALNEWEEF
jgi:hypothetical protein